MTTNSTSTESPTDTPVDETKIDDLGYDITETPQDTPAETPPVVEKPVEKPATGYGKKTDEPVTPPPAEPVVTPPVVEKKPEEMTDEEKAVKEISDTVAALGNEYDKEKLKKFALDNKFSKAQLEAYVNLSKAEKAELAKKAEEAKATQRKAWNEELEKDPEFGGVNFDKNVDRVERLLENHMPNTKKILTENGTVMPPYIMRDLLGIAKKLTPTTNLVVGDPATPPEEPGNFLDELYT